MNCEWIICERTGRWAAALRAALRRHPTQRFGNPRLHEVRSLDELSPFVDARPDAIAMLEVRRTDLAAAFGWLSTTNFNFPTTPCIALVDNEGFDDELRDDLSAALWAAGAVEICHSPRQMHRVFAIGRRHADSRLRKSTNSEANQSISDWAWALLPWQAAERQVG
jgi:hypothetical protein